MATRCVTTYEATKRRNYEASPYDNISALRSNHLDLVDDNSPLAYARVGLRWLPLAHLGAGWEAHFQHAIGKGGIASLTMGQSRGQRQFTLKIADADK